MYEKNDNESQLDYVIRLIKGKLDGSYDIDYAELSNLLGWCLSSDETRKRVYGCKTLIELFEQDKENRITDNDLLKAFQIEKTELQKEKYKIQTEKIELNKWIREQAREELFWEKVIQAIEKKDKPKIPEYLSPTKNIKKDGVLGFGDAHYGKEILIRGLKGETLNLYNVEIFEKRMWDLLDQTIKVIQKENLEHLNVFDLDDSIDGILRISQLKSLELGIIDSVVGYSDFLAFWLAELSKHVTIDLYRCAGNHSEIRPLASKKGDFAYENMSRLINRDLKLILKDNPNITIHDTSNLQLANVMGINILATHGQDEKNLENSIKDYTTLYNIKIDMLLTGHLHSYNEKTIGAGMIDNIRYVQVPSICGIDDYSMSLKKSSKAGSNLLIFEEGKGKTNNYDIKLN